MRTFIVGNVYKFQAEDEGHALQQYYDAVEGIDELDANYVREQEEGYPFFNLILDLNNDAFDSPGEIARILNTVAQDLEHALPADLPEDEINLLDSNGNDAGVYFVDEAEL